MKPQRNKEFNTKDTKNNLKELCFMFSFSLRLRMFVVKKFTQDSFLRIEFSSQVKDENETDTR